MSTVVVDDARIRWMQGTEDDLDSSQSSEKRFVLYWMERAQRTEHNEALEEAVRHANSLGLPVLVACAIHAELGGMRRHVRFQIEGLEQVQQSLERRNIGFVAPCCAVEDVVERLTDLASDAAMVVADRTFLPTQRARLAELIEAVDVPVVRVETDAVVPVDVVSDKQEYAARTIRPKLHQHLDRFVVERRTRAVDTGWAGSAELPSVDSCITTLDLPEDPATAVVLQGGTSQARAHLERFLSESLSGYAERDPTPSDPAVSHLSPYLRFGQISPVSVVHAVRSSDASQADIDAFIEELVVRRELALNYARHSARTTLASLDSLPDWARETLRDHRDDPREHRYTPAELEAAETHDDAWNACMLQMKHTGYLHNHLRMYWAKQVLKWSASPGRALSALIALNNRYFLDGRCASSYANVMWTFGLHDRAFQENDVIGKVRPMTRSGLDRKIDVERFVESVGRS